MGLVWFGRDLVKSLLLEGGKELGFVMSLKTNGEREGKKNRDETMIALI